MEYIKHKLLFSEYFKSLNIPILIADIGAQGGLGKPWNLLDESLIQLIGFEPDKKSYDELCKNFPNNQYHNVALWSEETVRNYYLTSQDDKKKYGAGTSSMYPPNLNITKNNYGTGDKGRFTNKIFQVQCNALDNLIQDPMQIPDFIKIDTQGSEYEILRGAENILRNNALIVTTETWTEEIYKNAPLAFKIMELMHDYGYRLAKTELAAAYYHKTKERVHCQFRHSGFELLYIKEFEDCAYFTEDKLVKHIAICELFGYRDYALFLLDELQSVIFDTDRYETLRKILIENGKEKNQQYPSIRY